MHKLYSQCCVHNSKFPASCCAFVASLCSCVPFNVLLSSTEMPEPPNNTSHSAEAARACSHCTETKQFPACSLPALCGAFTCCTAPIAASVGLMYKRTPNLANAGEKFQTKAEKTVCILSFSVLELFTDVSWCSCLLPFSMFLQTHRLCFTQNQQD